MTQQLAEQYQNAIYRQFKATFTGFRVLIAWDYMKEAWAVDVIAFKEREKISITMLLEDDPRLFY